MNSNEDKENTNSTANYTESPQRLAKVKDAAKAIATRSEYTNIAAENLLNLQKIRAVHVIRKERMQVNFQTPSNANAAQQNSLVEGVLIVQQAPIKSAIIQAEAEIKAAEKQWEQIQTFQRLLNKGHLEIINPWLKEKAHQIAHLFATSPSPEEQEMLDVHEEHIDEIEAELSNAEAEFQDDNKESIDRKSLSMLVSNLNKTKQALSRTKNRELIHEFDTNATANNEDVKAVRHQQTAARINKEEREFRAGFLPNSIDQLHAVGDLWKTAVTMQNQQLSNMQVSEQEQWQKDYLEKLEAYIRQIIRPPSREEIHERTEVELTAHILEEGHCRIEQEREKRIAGKMEEEKKSELQTQLIEHFQSRGLDIDAPEIIQEMNNQIDSQLDQWRHSYQYFETLYQKAGEEEEIGTEEKELGNKADAYLAQPEIKDKLTTKVTAEFTKAELQVKKRVHQCVETLITVLNNQPSTFKFLLAQLKSVQKITKQNLAEAERQSKQAEFALVILLNPASQTKRSFSTFAANTSEEEIRITLTPLVEKAKALMDKGVSQDPFAMVAPASKAKGLLLTEINDKYFLMAYNKRNEVIVIDAKSHTLTDEEHQQLIEELKKPLEQRSHATTVAPKPVIQDAPAAPPIKPTLVKRPKSF